MTLPSSSPRIRFLALALPLLAAAPAWAQSCQSFWADGGLGLPSYPWTMATIDDGNGPALFVSETIWPQRVFRFDRAGWVDTSATLPAAQFRVLELQALDDGSGLALYARGRIDNVAYWARRWDGAQWLPTHPNFVPPQHPTAWPLTSGDLGDGPHIYGVIRPSNFDYQIAKWTGSEWLPLSTVFSAGSYFRLLVHDDGAGARLYALNGFVTMGFARWVSGTTWERPPSDDSGLVIYDALSFDDGSGPGLWVFGGVWVNGEPVGDLAKWNGQNWIGMGGPILPPQTVYAKRRLQVFDDGSGPALYVTGGFSNWNGIPARGIARWNGQVWSAVYDGVGPGAEVNAMAAGPGPYGPTLFIGGILNRAGGGTIRYVAQYLGCPNCYANCDLSTSPSTLNVNDFVCFMQKFAARDPYANCDNSTASPAINVNDFICFAQRFAAGCP